MKKLILFGVSAVLAYSMSFYAIAAPAIDEFKTIEVSMEDVIDMPSTLASSYTETLGKDFANISGTGIATSPGLLIDFSKILPVGSTVTEVTIYCPTSVKITQSKFTGIENYIITRGDKKAIVKFWQTDRPTYTSTTTELNGPNANTIWKIQIQGKVAANQSGMDGFTVGGGGQLIIKYK